MTRAEGWQLIEVDNRGLMIKGCRVSHNRRVEGRRQQTKGCRRWLHWSSLIGVRRQWKGYDEMVLRQKEVEAKIYYQTPFAFCESP